MRVIFFILGSLSATAYRGHLSPSYAEFADATHLQKVESAEEEDVLSQGAQYFANGSARASNPCEMLTGEYRKYCKTGTQTFENKRSKFTRGSRSEMNLCHRKNICVPIHLVCQAGYVSSGKKVCNAVPRPKPWKQVAMMEVPTPDPEDPEALPAKSKKRSRDFKKARPGKRQRQSEGQKIAAAVQAVEAAPSDAEIAEKAVNACMFVPMKYCKMPEFETKRKKFTAGWYADAKKRKSNPGYNCAKHGSCVPKGFRCHKKQDFATPKKWCGACEIRSTWKSTISGYALERCK
jgi:hypothetical protein